MPIAPTPIPPPPDPAPLRSDSQEVFDLRAESYAVWASETLPPALDALAENVYDNAVESIQVTAANAAATASSASSAAGSAAAASSSAASASSSAANLAATLALVQTIHDQLDDRFLGAKSADPTLDNDGNPLVDGACYINTVSGLLRAYTVAHGWTQGIAAIAGVSSINSLMGDVTLKTVGGHALPGSGDIPTTPSMFRVQRTSNTMLVHDDQSKLIDIVSGTFAQTFDDAASLGDGWFVVLRNQGGGIITLTPNGLETIGGLATAPLHPGETAWVSCDGSALHLVFVEAQPAAQRITPTAVGQAFTLPDATTARQASYAISNDSAFPALIRDASGAVLGIAPAYASVSATRVDDTTPAGVWALAGAEWHGLSARGTLTLGSAVAASLGGAVYLRSVALDAMRTLILISGTSVHAVVHDSADGTFGAPVLVRNADVGQYITARLHAADAVLVVSAQSTALQAVILSVSGKSITVNTAAAATLPGALSYNMWAPAHAGVFEPDGGLVAVGADNYVFAYANASQAQIRALQVTGTAVTIGAALNVSSTSGNFVAVFRVSATLVLTLSISGSTFHAAPYTVSGSVLTPGTSATQALTSVGSLSARAIGAHWLACTASGGSGSAHALIVSVTGTTATLSYLTNIGLGTVHQITTLSVRDQQALVIMVGNSGIVANVVTNNNGTATAGTPIVVFGVNPVSSSGVMQEAANGVWYYAQDNSQSPITGLIHLVEISGANAVSSRAVYAGLTQSGLDAPSGYAIGTGPFSEPRKLFGARSNRCVFAAGEAGSSLSFDGAQASIERQALARPGISYGGLVRHSASAMWRCDLVTTSRVQLSRYEAV